MFVESTIMISQRTIPQTSIFFIYSFYKILCKITLNKVKLHKITSNYGKNIIFFQEKFNQNRQKKDNEILPFSLNLWKKQVHFEFT